MARQHLDDATLGAFHALLEQLWDIAPREPARWRRLLESAAQASGATHPPPQEALSVELLALMGREAYLACDAAFLREVVSAMSSRTGGSALDRLAVALYQQLLCTLHGKASALSELERIEADARAAQGPILVVDAVTAQARLLCTQLGASHDALSRARRALRMAGAESSPFQELTACIVLGAARRAEGKAHLTRRTLAMVTPLLPSALLGWAHLEGVLCGLAGPSRPVQSPIDTVAAALADACTASTHEPWERARLAADSAEGGQALRDLAACALCLLGAHEPTELAERWVDGWVDGQVHDAPLGLLAVGGFSAQRGAPAFVFADPRSSRPRRVLAAALTRLAPQTVLDPDAAPQERTVMAIAKLLLQEEALEESLFFQELYGFPFESALHRPVLNKLLSRARSLLGETATLHRDSGTLRLETHQSLAIWDPRCAPSLENRLMVALGSQPRSASGVAEGLGYSKRAIQMALKRLVEDGACRPVTHGREVVYVLEDTALTSLTVARFQR